MIISVMFEFLEYSLEHQLPNFSECWWDHVRTNISERLILAHFYLVCTRDKYKIYSVLCFEGIKYAASNWNRFKTMRYTHLSLQII